MCQTMYVVDLTTDLTTIALKKVPFLKFNSGGRELPRLIWLDERKYVGHNNGQGMSRVDYICCRPNGLQ